MAIQIQEGHSIPSVTVKKMGEDGLIDINIADHIANKKVIIFAVPGAFTPTCSQQHLPSYIKNYDSIRASGIDEIICISVNDPFVMAEWEKASGAAGKVTMIPDGNAELTKNIGMDFDGAGFGLGTRSLRYLMYVEHGKVTDLQIENSPGDMTITSGDECLSLLKKKAA